MQNTGDHGKENVALGITVFDEDGNSLGTVQGIDEHGFYVTHEEGIEGLSSEHRRTGTAGEAELTWRCSECGTIGKISEMPDEGCPDCGAPREAIYYYLED
jgi:Zn finger protein HypA/HybF involved in hydrogenase expression